MLFSFTELHWRLSSSFGLANHLRLDASPHAPLPAPLAYTCFFTEFFLYLLSSLGSAG